MKTKLFNKAKGLMVILLLLTTFLSYGQTEDITVNITDASSANAEDGCIELMVNFDSDAPNPDETGEIIPPFFYIWVNSEGVIIQGEDDEADYLGENSLCGYSAGTYFVTVTDGNGCNATGSFTINIEDTAPFTAQIEGDEIATIGQTIDFGGSVNPEQTESVSWEWDFGQGASPATSLQQNPNNISYESSGFKTVRLTATNSLGQIATTTHQVYVEETALIADFDWFNIGGFNVVFSASVSNNFGTVTYEWDYGNGASDGPLLFPNINHLYESGGQYEVTLKVCDNNGCVSVVKTINVGTPVFTVNIITATTEGVTYLVDNDNFETIDVPIGATVDFVAEATNNGGQVAYTWNFDGGESMDANMPCICPETSATFTNSGCYQISVIATDAVGNTQSIKNCLIRVATPEFTLTGIRSFDHCSLLEHHLHFSHIGGEAFDDPIPVNPDNPCFGTPEGFIYFPNYQWTAESIITEPNGQVQQYGTNLFIASTTSSPCAAFNFEQEDLKNALENEGSFSFNCKLSVTDKNGVVSNIVSEITLYNDLVVEANDITACSGSSVLLGASPTAQGGTGNYTYRWENMDFSTPQDLSCTDCPNPLVEVPADGEVKQYRLVVTDRRSPLDDCEEERIIEVRGASLVADAGPSTILACVNNSLQQLGNLSENTASGGTGNYSYMWSPVIGLSDPTIANPIVTALPTDSETTYTLTVYDNTGCSATDEITVVSSASYPQAYAGIAQTEICYGEAIQLGGNPTGTGIGIVGDLEYLWTNPSNEPFSTEANPTIPSFSTEDENGLYTVTVVDNANGCFNTSTVQVSIRERLSYEGFSIGFHNECLEDGLSGSAFTMAGHIDGGEAPYSYQWEHEDIVSDPNVLNPIMMPSAEHPFNRLFTYDAYGCLVYNHNPSNEEEPEEFIRSDLWVLDDAKPDVAVDVPNGILCANEEICVDIVIDRHFLIEDTEEFGLAFPNLEFDWRVRSSSATIIAGSKTVGDAQEINGIYYTQICFTINAPGNYIFDLLNIINHCGATHHSSDIIISNPSQDIDFLQVCNNTTDLDGIEMGVYAAHGVEVGGDCKAFVLDNFTVHTKSDNKINLFQGFHAKRGSSFTARIEPLEFCDGLISEEVIERSQEETLIAVNDAVKLNVYPNPFEQNLEISFEVKDGNQHNITINILSVTGTRIAALYKETVIGKGVYRTNFQSKDLPAGIYLCEFNIDGQVITRKILKI